MRAVAAQLAGGERNADRFLVAEDAIVVLDGATAFEPVDLDPGEYAEAIGQEIVRRLPNATIADSVAGAIDRTARVFGLKAGRSPSSTVSVLRVREGTGEVDLYVLGDSPIYYGVDETAHVLRDGRLDDLAQAERADYVEGLRSGHGFTQEHRQNLKLLQREQRRLRNREGGYWIAETTPDAAHHGMTLTLQRRAVSWAVLGTDGAMDLIAMRPDINWHRIAKYSYAELSELLVQLHLWERDVDPHGQFLPRAKRHDDKTLVAVSDLAEGSQSAHSVS